MEISFNHDLELLGKTATAIQKEQLPFANALALTKTAQIAKSGVEKQLDKDIDRPTPFTKRGFVVTRATKKKPISSVSIRGIQADYLKYQIDGGTRSAVKGKPVLLPGANLTLNKYGNIARNRLRGTKTAKNYFTKNGVIYKRLKKRIKPMAVFRDSADYSKRFRYYERLTGEAKANYPRELSKAINYAVKTAM